MKITVVGGTGFLGYQAVKVGLERGHAMSSIAINDITLGDWYPKDVTRCAADVFRLTLEELIMLLFGYEALVYAVGPDDRVTPPAPAYEFFHTRLVDNCEKVVIAARRAGIRRCVILNSYFAYFDRIWPQKQLSLHHPYIRCRVEQAERAIAAGENKMDVMILELPYIFGSMPSRTPIWKDVLLDRFTKGNVIFFPKGGTNMIAARHIGEAIIGAVERGEHGQRYPIGDENHTYRYMLETMMNAMGTPKKIIGIPRFAAELAGTSIERKLKKQGLESGLDPRYIMRDVMTDELYFDPSESAAALGFKKGGLKEAIEDTVRACYPEKFHTP